MASKYEGQYYINGQDAYLTYGMIFEKGAFDALLKLPDTKDGYSEEWADQTGTDYMAYPDTVLSSLSIDVPFILLATDRNDFIAKYNKLRDFFLPGIVFNMDVPDLNMRFKLRYTKMPNFNKITKLKTSGKVASKLTLTLVDDFPDMRTIFSTAFDAAKAAGYTTDQSVFEAAINELPFSYRQEAQAVLAPGIYKTGLIAGVKYDGTLSPFTFARAGTATYIDKNGVLQTAAANMPRIDYSDGTPRYLFEGASTNNQPLSEGFASWSLSNISGTVTVTDGGNFFGAASKLVKLSSTSIYKYPSGYHNNTQYVISVYVRAIGSDVLFRLSTDGNGVVPGNAVFNLQTKTVSSHSSVNDYGIIDCGNGICRCFIVITTSATGSNFSNLMGSGTGTSGTFEIFGVQCEVGNYPTSYIPTNGASVTRPADVINSAAALANYPAATLYLNAGITPLPLASYITPFMASNSNGDKVLTTIGANTPIVNSKNIMAYDSAGVLVANNAVVVTGVANSALPTSSTSAVASGTAAMALGVLAAFARKFSSSEAQTLTT